MRGRFFSRKKAESKDPITWRGHEVTRIEAFSDAVFAFAITLLVISLEVPKTSGELFRVMQGFGSFAACFAIFFQIWMVQNKFFRRFGMHDETVLVLNAILMFMVLFFVYPLKFFFSCILSREYIIESEKHARYLYLLYGIGFAVIYLCFSLMYAHAIRKKEHLKLTDKEVFEAQTYIYRLIVIASFGMLSALLGMMGGLFIQFAWIPYPLLGIGISMVHRRRAKTYKKLFGEDKNVEVRNAPEEIVSEIADDDSVNAELEVD